MGCSIGEATGSRKGGRVKHFRPFVVPRVCHSVVLIFFFEKKRPVGGGLDCAHKSRSSGYVNNVTD